MNILISSGLLSLAIILLADSIRQLSPHKTRKTKRRTGWSKEHSMTRTHVSVIELTQTDLRANN